MRRWRLLSKTTTDIFAALECAARLSKPFFVSVIADHSQRLLGLARQIGPTRTLESDALASRAEHFSGILRFSFTKIRSGCMMIKEDEKRWCVQYNEKQ
jgi:hypothetical protein